ncbi:PilZ domain-containing protein [Methylocaldum sp.]|uniref:PilZ domain-containing protein n=1 Tax=Methylocaldum sp. TaxID=1969727 RepID=UPI002D4D43EC|nr:PilZ domain-containing protein [Methylocaldum sp.]HYE34801.1 PilZ domain-containing protein [Methylocaldum sp.]
MLEFDEKRDFIRMQAHCKMSFRLADGDAVYEGACVNISGSGILFETDTTVDAGKAVEVRLVPDNKITPPLTAYIEVIRCTETEAGRYRIAGAIKGIKSE